MSEETLTISDSAAQQIAATANTKDAKPMTALRITVLGGGCSGFQYEIGFDHHRFDDDIEIKYGDAAVVIDEISLDYIRGSVIDYERDMMGERFVINNPQATSGCGCGKSFGM